MLVTLQGYRVEKQQDDGKKDKRAVMREMIEQRKKGNEETRNRTISEQRLKKREKAKEGWEQPIENDTCKFSTIVVEKDEYKDGHHEPDQKPPLFSFLPACVKKKKVSYLTTLHCTAQFPCTHSRWSETKSYEFPIKLKWTQSYQSRNVFSWVL